MLEKLDKLLVFYKETAKQTKLHKQYNYLYSQYILYSQYSLVFVQALHFNVNVAISN